MRLPRRRAPDGTILKVNQTFLTWSGYTREELVGERRFDELLSAGGRIYHETHYAPMLRMHGAVREIALDIVRADGRRLPALVNSVLDARRDDAPMVDPHRRVRRDGSTGVRAGAAPAPSSAPRSPRRRRGCWPRTLQRTLIPPACPTIPGSTSQPCTARRAPATTSVATSTTSSRSPTDDWIVVVGDVCGKGVEAAVITAVARYTIRGARSAPRRPA